MNRQTVVNRVLNAVGLVDHIMVGSLGTEAMTAVSIIGQLLFVLSLAVFGGISGSGIYAAQFYGQGNTEGVRAATRMKLWVCAVCVAGGTVILFFGKSFLIRLYLHGESAEINSALTVSYAKEYLHIMLAGIPAMAITQIYSSSLRETGESFKPMISGIVSVSADIVFNYLLIYGSFGFPKLGVAGAALATVIARYLEMTVIVLWAFLSRKKHTFVQGLWRTLRIPKEICKKIISKSVPIFFNEFLWAAGLAVLTQCYSTRGLEVVAGINISNILCNLLNVVFVALGYAVGILIGQTLGVALIALSGFFPLVYDTTERVRSLATHFIIVSALFFPVQGILNSVYFTLRSGGKTLVTFLFDSVFSWSVTVPTAFLLCLLTDLNIITIFAIVQAVDIIKIIIGARMIKKGIWVSNLAEEFS